MDFQFSFLGGKAESAVSWGLATVICEKLMPYKQFLWKALAAIASTFTTCPQRMFNRSIPSRNLGHEILVRGCNSDQV